MDKPSYTHYLSIRNCIIGVQGGTWEDILNILFMLDSGSVTRMLRVE